MPSIGKVVKVNGGRLYNVVSTSIQHHDVASTLMQRCLNAQCPLGYYVADEIKRILTAIANDRKRKAAERMIYGLNDNTIFNPAKKLPLSAVVVPGKDTRTNVNTLRKHAYSNILKFLPPKKKMKIFR